MSYPYQYPEGDSDCCGADVYNGICSECGEHCEVEDDNFIDNE